MNNQLAQNFRALSLLKFAAPTTAMLIFMSLYQMVDGVFVANFVGETALSALNIVYPIPSIIIALSIMLSTGGSAIIARNMGEGKHQEAKENFSLLLCVGLILGLAVLVLGTIFLRPLIHLLGATPNLYQYCHDYLQVLILTAPLAVFQMLFQTFFVTAGKPYLGLTLTVIGGFSNIVLDYLFIAVLGWGVRGAAVATSIGYSVPAIFGLFYFALCRSGTLFIIKPVCRWTVLLHSCGNGSSEMVNNLAIAVTTFLFNILMLKYAGEAGVAAITIVLYAQFLMTSLFIGFSSGIAPVISYNYGRQNHGQLQNVFRISMRTIAVFSVLIYALSWMLASAIIQVFAPVGSALFELTRHGFHLFSVSFLFTGFNIFASAMFTAFSNGKVSAILSLMRTFVFLIVCLMVLPLFLDVDGVWLAVPVAELLALAVSVYYVVTLRQTYHYHC